MSDVFISYSRIDTRFVREILELLDANKREAWIDLHDIEYSGEWWKEICAGIDGADNFVLFISPSSMQSLYVHREIEYAISHQKRIIPFLISRVDQPAIFEAWQNNPELSKYDKLTHANWDRIQAIQWIDYTQLNSTDLAVKALLETVDTDPERVRLHTRLLLRMRDWEGQGRNPSGFLRGEELAQYEQWLLDTHQKGTPPHATIEQEAYVAKSRQNQDAEEAKRLQRERLVRGFRIASMVLGGFFLLAVIATIFAIVFANNAVSAQQTAIAQKGESNTQVALGNTEVAIIGQTLTPIPPKLTAVAQTLVAGSSKIEALNLSAAANNILRTEGGNAETAALLSIRVLRRIYLPNADSALMEATSRLRAVPSVFKVDDRVNGVTFSPDGKTFLIGYGYIDGGGAELIDTASGKVIWMIQPLPCIYSAAFSPDGKLIVLADGDHKARLLDAASGKTIRVLREDVISGHRAVFSPDGKTILVLGASDLTVTLWNVKTGEQIYSVPAGGGAPSLFFFPDGQTFYASGNNVYSTSDGHQNQGNNRMGGALAISPDGKTYVKSAAQLLDTSSGQVLQTLSGHTDDIWSAAFSKDSKMLVTGSKDNTARVWDVASGKLLFLLSGQNSLVSSVAFSPDGTKVLTGSSEGNYAYLWDITGDNQQQTFFAPAGVSASALAPNGKTILVGDVEGNSGLWDLDTGQMLHNFRNCSPDIKTVAFSPDGKLLAIPDCFQGPNLSFKLYDASSAALLKTFSITAYQPSIGSLTFSSDSKMIFAAYQDSSSRLWDIASGQILRLFSGSDPDNQTSAYSPDGKLISRGVNFWLDISSGAEVEFPGTISEESPSVFSGDGNLLAISDPQGNVSVWTVSTKQLINHFLSGHADRITNLSFSPDNKLLLTGSADKTARLWDISSGQLLRVFSGHSAAISSVAFSPDGKRIITTSLDKTVRTWITDYNDLIAYACSRVGRDLTPQQRMLYGITDQEPTCPQFGDQSQPLLPTTTPMPTREPLPGWTPIATPTPEKTKP